MTDVASAWIGSARLGSARISSAQLGSTPLWSAWLWPGSAQLSSAQLDSAPLSSDSSTCLGLAQLGLAQPARQLPLNGARCKQKTIKNRTDIEKNLFGAPRASPRAPEIVSKGSVLRLPQHVRASWAAPRAPGSAKIRAVSVSFIYECGCNNT